MCTNLIENVKVTLSWSSKQRATTPLFDARGSGLLQKEGSEHHNLHTNKGAKATSIMLSSALWNPFTWFNPGIFPEEEAEADAEARQGDA